MRVRATASATERSNAIGVVELDCTPHGLLLGFLGVGSFTEGYAPGALATGVQLTVPWSAVRQARADGDQVYLELDWPGLPHDRLTLTRFSLGNAAHPLELRRQRMILHIGAVTAAALASIVAAAVVPRLSATTTAALTLCIGAAAALTVLAIGFLIDQRLLVSPLGDASLRAAFLSELEGYFPNLIRTPVAPPPRRPQKKTPNLAGFFPRTTTAVAITLAAGIVTSVGTARHLLRPPPIDDVARQTSLADGAPSSATQTSAVAPEGPEAPAAQSAPATAPSPPPRPNPHGITVGQKCVCQRASSPLWEEPIPTLSLLVLDVQQTVRRNRTRTYLEVAVVNNGHQPLNEITVHANFFDEEGGERHRFKQRPLYFEGPLGPGRAIKWRTEAAGTHWEVDPPFFGQLDLDGSNAAPSDTFRALLKANHRPVRLHAARMLAFLGDSSAAQATLQLREALRSSEAPYLRRLLAALADVRVCNVQVTGAGSKRRAEACVYNSTDQDRDQLGLQLVALDRPLTPERPVDTPPELLADRKWPLPEPLPAHTGVLLHVPFDLAELSAEQAMAFEWHADRFDLLD